MFWPFCTPRASTDSWYYFNSQSINSQDCFSSKLKLGCDVDKSVCTFNVNKCIFISMKNVIFNGK